ncbi:Hypothetical Protein FCC1311_088542 [Hondaea fermentalgiana]|uniref:C2 domain-containing protein n=1 Tax=Hondaea fermentalgiana TaxID=2315210 RepID=A0A2R5GQP1_9STRA|nr:Hypothetical Protein FCC1311_088542 [Hondaea fermentalgiana]|eukprot:GBG32629.1 Hypothetical Protein FCC1311_088542 [Hondaea fermentalgiana]
MAATLEVEVRKCTFAKPLNYFLSLQLNDGEKLRTEVADASSKPVFKNNTFRMRANAGEDLAYLRIGGFLIVRKDGEAKGQPSLLGSGEVDLGALGRQLAGGKSVLCDDVTLRRKSKKQGQGEIVVGKVQLSIRALDPLNPTGSADLTPTLHPDTCLCNMIVHRALVKSTSGLQPPLDANRCLAVEGRVVSEQAHFLMMALREDPSHRTEFTQMWPMPTWRGSMRSQAHRRQRPDNFEQFDWNETDVFRIEPRMAENNKAVRIDLVDLPVPDAYTNGGLPRGSSDSTLHSRAVSPRFDPLMWESRGGATLALGFLRKLQQYNLRLQFTDELELDLSVELQPSFNDNYRLFSAQRSNAHATLRRVHVHVVGIQTPLHAAVSDCFVRVSGTAKDPSLVLPSDPFVTCKSLQSIDEDIEPSRKPPKEAHVSLETYPVAEPYKVTARSGPLKTQTPRWDCILEFNAEGDSFADAISLEFFRDDAVKFAQASINVHGLARNGTVHSFSDIPLRSVRAKPKDPDPAATAADPEAEVTISPETEIEAETKVDQDVESEDPPTCQLNVRIWDCAAYLDHLGSTLEERASGSPRILSTRTSEFGDVESAAPLSTRSPRQQTASSESAQTPHVPRLPIASGEQPRLERSNTKMTRASAADGEEARTKSRRQRSPQQQQPERVSGRLEDRPTVLTSREPPTPELTPVPSRSSTPSEPEVHEDVGRNDSHASRRRRRSTIGRNVPELPLPESGVDEHSSAEAILEERLAIVTSDVKNKQVLIDKLLDDLDQRAEAIRICGAEIVELRKEKDGIARAKDAVEARLRAIEEEHAQDAAALAQDIQNIGDPDDLRRRVTLLARKYANERKRNQEMMDRLGRVQEVVDDHRAAVQQLEELERAHQAQGRVVLELQEENAQLQLFQTTIKTQEKVIVKLEDLLESKLREQSAIGMNPAVHEDLEREMEQLRSRNKDLEDKLLHGDLLNISGADDLRSRIKDLEAQLEEARATSSSVVSSARGTSESGVGSAVGDGKDERIEALEEQLVQNAKSFAGEIAKARMKIFEYEAILDENDNTF